MKNVTDETSATQDTTRKEGRELGVAAGIQEDFKEVRSLMDAPAEFGGIRGNLPPNAPSPRLAEEITDGANSGQKNARSKDRA